MATSGDHLYLPSREEAKIVQFKTTSLQSEMDAQKVIEQSRLRLDEPTQQSNERKSRISPVRDANFDVLSIIFEHCGEIDWISPLKIAAVSRLWREVILHSPRAWRFIDFRDRNRSCVNAYFERSGQCGLHVAVDNPFEVKQFAQVAHRVRCLSIPLLQRYVGDLTFPRLICLRNSISSDFLPHINPDVITPSRFPNLRHLELRSDMLAVVNCETLPSLQTLNMMVFDNDGWRELLTSCKETLISLQIMRPAGRDTPQVPRMELPNLRYLKVVDGVQDDCSWASPLVTPTLKAYWEESACSEAQTPRETTPTITHLRLKRVPPMLPARLRVLQLDISVERFGSLIHDLKTRLSLCPHLEIIEFGRTYVTNQEVAEMETMLNQWDGQARPKLLRPPTITENWVVGLPCEIEAECGKNMPCARW